MQEYNPKKIESKWQKHWAQEKLYQAKDFAKKPKVYLLVEFPYPSGEGLHVGHCRSYTAMDVLARKRRMQGYNVLFPMGWDAFGLPTENFAIKTGKHPAKVTKENTATFKRQEKSLGLSFDWLREINTTDHQYYKWTQWIFLQMFKKGLAYKKKMPINWCLACKIGLANEEVIEGKCERCGGQVERKEKEQWLLKITDYAERLIDDLDKVDYPERVKTLQKDWIGQSSGFEIVFSVKDTNNSISDDRHYLNQVQKQTINVFTTRIDTLFGCTYLVVSPEHPFVASLLKNQKSKIKNIEEIKTYFEKSKHKLERERLAKAKEKTGVKLEGVAAVNPANNKKIPIFTADYVLMNYGTGAIMAVPKHDLRDMQFAMKYKLPVVEVIKPLKNQKSKIKNQNDNSKCKIEDAYEGEGILVNSGEFNGSRSQESKEKIGQWLKGKGLAEKKVYYKLRDWIFSRQRYWGEPIPLIFCERCGWQPVEDKDLPVKLPDVKNYQPTEKGESPLASVDKWVNTKCPKCGGKAKRETDVMPNWAGSNWYYLAYTMLGNQKSKSKNQNDKSKIKNGKFIWDKEKMKYWLPVDWYDGGMEHTTLHLLYSRFVYKFLWDIGAVPKELGEEPYKKRTSHGMILAQGGVKMSKSKGNVINPDEVIEQYGADTLRVYEMFMGPFSQAIAWDTKGVRGVYRFLQKAYKLTTICCHPEARSAEGPSGARADKKTLRLSPQSDGGALKKLLHQTIKKVSEDIENMKFNTAVSALMILTNETTQCLDVGRLNIEKEELEDFLKILAPFAPHLAEEMWQALGNKQSIFLQNWPEYDTNIVKEAQVILIVQVNGKIRDKIKVKVDLTEDEVKEIALKSVKVKKWLIGKQVNKIIFIPNKLVNIVV